MAGVRGDFGGLARLRQAADAVVEPEFRAELAMAMGAAAMKVLADEFRSSTNPYGTAWEALKLRTGLPLLDTGRLRASASLLPRPEGFEIDISAPYAATHQYGAHIKPVRAKMLSWKARGGRKRYFAHAVTIPRRQMLPEASTGGLGPIWTRALTDAAEGYVRRHFQGGRL